ncbi:MAG: ABC transporter substrate-binding protein [Gaiellales bacterium]
MTKGRYILIAAVAALAAFLVAFGPAPKRNDGDTLIVTSMAAPDSLDPGVSYQAVGWQILNNAYDGLLTYNRVGGPAGNTVIPDIAESMPKISPDGKTYTLIVRKGVKFAPPVNRDVTASDVKYTFDRLALLPTPAPFYHAIVGYDELAKSHKGTISGITADNATGTVTFHIKQADATFLYALAVNFASIVPKGTPARDLSQAGFVPGTGPYMLTKYQPGSLIELKRNPNYHQWSKAMPTGGVDGIDVKLGVSDENATTLIMQGKADLAFTAIPRSKWPFLKNSPAWKPYLHVNPGAITSYLYMNVHEAPFNNVKVRQAMNWAVDRRALIKLGGGAGTPTSNILPPLLPGGNHPSNPYPKVDMAKAKALIASAGPLKKAVKIWYSSDPVSKDRAQYIQDVLQRLGFQARSQALDGSSYFQIVGNAASHAQIGFASWSADFPEATNFFSALLYGKTIDPKASNNLAFYSGSDKEITRINKISNLAQRNAAWSKLDGDMMAQQAPWIPYSSAVSRELVSKRVGNLYNHPVYDAILSRITVDGTGTNNKDMHEGELPIDNSTSSKGGNS